MVLDVPAGVRLARPILLRWASGAPGLAVLGRTVITLGDGASASVVEELVPSAADPAGAQSFLAGSTEVVLGRDADLSMASIQELGPRTVTFQHRGADRRRGRRSTGPSPSSVRA